MKTLYLHQLEKYISDHGIKTLIYDPEDQEEYDHIFIPKIRFTEIHTMPFPGIVTLCNRYGDEETPSTVVNLCGVNRVSVDEDTYAPDVVFAIECQYWKYPARTFQLFGKR